MKWVPPSCLQICAWMGQQHQQLSFHQCPHRPDLQYLLQDLLHITFGKRGRYQEISNPLQISTGVRRIYDLIFPSWEPHEILRHRLRNPRPDQQYTSNGSGLIFWALHKATQHQTPRVAFFRTVFWSMSVSPGIRVHHPSPCRGVLYCRVPGLQHRQRRPLQFACNPGLVADTARPAHPHAVPLPAERIEHSLKSN